MSSFEFKHYTVHYQVEGEANGPGLVFLHGLGGSSVNWLNQRMHFKRQYQVITIDMPGHGKSHSEGPVEFTDFKRIIYHLMQEILQLDAVYLCGVSMGGRVALDFAAHYPAHAKGIVVADTFAGLDDEEKKRRKAIFELLDEPNGEAKWARKVIDEMGLDPEGAIASGFQKGILANQLSFIQDLFYRMLDIDHRDQLVNVQAPTLILHGERDRFVPRSCAEDLHQRIARSRLEIIPDCGHLPNVEQPKVFNRLLGEFLENCQIG